jgi:hypothetical protein
MRRECLVLWVSANDLLAEASNDIVNGKVCASPEYSRTVPFVGHLVSSFTPIVCSAMARVCPFARGEIGLSTIGSVPTRVIATNPRGASVRKILKNRSWLEFSFRAHD